MTHAQTSPTQAHTHAHSTHNIHTRDTQHTHAHTAQHTHVHLTRSTHMCAPQTHVHIMGTHTPQTRTDTHVLQTRSQRTCAHTCTQHTHVHTIHTHTHVPQTHARTTHTYSCTHQTCTHGTHMYSHTHTPRPEDCGPRARSWWSSPGGCPHTAPGAPGLVAGHTQRRAPARPPSGPLSEDPAPSPARHSGSLLDGSVPAVRGLVSGHPFRCPEGK